VPATAVDTSVIVAALLSWHERHEDAFRALEALLASNDGIVLPAPALVEAYSVMTRLPPPHRLAPKDAFALLEESFRGAATVVQLTPEEVWLFLQNLAEAGVHGGQTYDGQIVACAARQGAQEILTLNPRDFERLAPPELAVRSV